MVFGHPGFRGQITEHAALMDVITPHNSLPPDNILLSLTIAPFQACGQRFLKVFKKRVVQQPARRQGYRNGHYLRDLLTRFGLVEDIRVPRVTPGGTEFTVLNRYEHRRRGVDAPRGPLFLRGVSTRKLKTIARELFGQEVSAQTVSNALASLDQELTGYRTKPLGDTVEFLFLDGMSSKVREIGIEKKVG